MLIAFNVVISHAMILINLKKIGAKFDHHPSIDFDQQMSIIMKNKDLHVF